MKSRLFAFVVAFVLILGLVPVVGAQGTECYGLSDADCKLMQDAEANSVNIKSFAFNFALDLSADASALMMMTGDATSSGKIALTVSGSGALSMAADAADPMKALAMKADVKGSSNDGTGDKPFETSIVIKDGILYAQDPADGSWHGTELAAALQSSGLPIDPTTMLSDPSALMGAAGMGDLSSLGLGDLDVTKFITQERLGDESMMGQTMYPFQLSLDLGALLNDPAVQQAINTAMTAASGTEGAGSEMAMVGMMLPMIFQGSAMTIDITQWIGADDMFIHKMAMGLDASIDLNALMAMAGGGAEVPKLDPIIAVVDVSIEMSDINSAVDVVAPEGAIMEPAAS